MLGGGSGRSGWRDREIFPLTWCGVGVCYRESIDLSEYPCEREYARALPVEQF